ncbi:hypothetical protein VTO42DRAFT_6973 [Malbranchea cinnamomea]
MREPQVVLCLAVLLGVIVNYVWANGHLEDPLRSFLLPRRRIGHDELARRHGHSDRVPTLLVGSSGGASLHRRSDNNGPQNELDSVLRYEQQYNASVAAACRDAVGLLRHVANPLGLVACYNVPFFDNTTGKFVAEVRYYQASDQRDEFAGIPLSALVFEVTVPQAELSPAHPLEGAHNHDSDSDSDSDSSTPPMVYRSQHIGYLNSMLQLDKLSLGDLRILLIPNITVLASSRGTRDPGTTSINASLSSDTLSYLVGLFTPNASSMSPFTPSFPSSPSPPAINITLAAATARLPAILESAAPEFKLPGTTLASLPVSLVITGVWTTVLVSVVGWGTWDRWRFRRYYRTRIRVAAVGR